MPPVHKPLTLKTALKAFGLFCTFTGSGLIGYKLFVSLPSYNGPTRDIQSKPIIITQPYSKISRQLLYNLAQHGAHLILADNNWDKCEELRERLMRKYGVKSDMIECRRLELDSMTSIRRFAAGILADFSQLDCVIIQSPSCISSIIAGKRRFTHDGFEHELGVNYFAAYLLSRLLIDKLNENKGRLIFVMDTQAADTAQENAINQLKTSQVTIPLDNINWENDKDYTPENAYQRAQWFLLMFADELTRRNSTKDKKASILIANPRISRGISPEMDKKHADNEIFWKLLNIFLDVCPRLISRKTSGTTILCATSDSSIIDLTDNNIDNKSNSTVHCAPIYQDLRLLISSNENNKTIEDRRQASELLWKLSEKWTRLDTHPNALPLPTRQSVQNDSRSDTSVNSIPTIHA